MPLAHLLDQFQNVRYTTPMLLARSFGMIYAWKCQSWLEDCPSQIATVLLVYRSPLVKDTMTLYQPVAQAILEADMMEVLGQGVREDEEMMNGSGEYTAFMLCPAGYVKPASAPSAEEVNLVITETMEGIRI